MRWSFPALIVCLLLVHPAHAGAQLLLVDGQILEGEDVELKKRLYLLRVGEGEVIPVPAELVRELRLTGDDDPDATGLKAAEPETLAGPPSGPVLKRTGEQLEAFGERRSRFRPNLVDPVWRPSRGWPRPGGNDFNPARWRPSILDPIWRPRSAYRESGDVTEFNPARWYRAPIQSTWWPSDGFADTPNWFAPIVTPRR